ncbi:SixA phosphatase family protein [Winogradskyella sp. UBA3174]|uniref:SixA phosphatase family protein n=1 Tax=Winogradskyella sp. UBA3174 TaxID=1947785 RepID=UPI0025DC7055|nr:histidine phosphatase family protein [Winogradskyella sp. UBA3174]|tara:strand:- start:7879 stop:8364 length:486 start_codon:yes stop_codon:yes gene_type:complete
MKSVILVRHGKSSWGDDVIDKDRPLKSRGESDTSLVAKEFINHQISLDKILSSSAKRAFTTCEIFCKVLNYDKNEVEVRDDLYDFGGENVISVIKTLKDDINTIMIFGHNHAFTSISNIFGSKFIENLPTGGLVKLNFEIHTWSAFNKGITELVIVPKELR